MKYGSAFVGTGSPASDDGCAYYDSNLKNYVILNKIKKEKSA